MKTCFIYTLSDPETKEIRYVGKCENPHKRLREHLNDKRVCHKSSWIKNLKSKGKEPLINIVESCDDNNWQLRESFWIRKLRSDGFRLTNMNDGGLGGCSPSPEVIEKIRLSKIGLKRKPFYTEKMRELVSLRFKGKKKTREQIEKMGWWWSKKVFCETTGKPYKSLRFASVDTKTDKRDILKSCEQGISINGLLFCYIL